VTRTFKEICALTNVAKKEIGRCYKILQQHFQTGQAEITFESMLVRFANELDLDPKIANMSCKVGDSTFSFHVFYF
jgi:transcription initiation factor TFIIB